MTKINEHQQTAEKDETGKALLVKQDEEKTEIQKLSKWLNFILALSIILNIVLLAIKNIPRSLKCYCNC